MGLSYGVEDGYLRLEPSGSVVSLNPSTVSLTPSVERKEELVAPTKDGELLPRSLDLTVTQVLCRSLSQRHAQPVLRLPQNSIARFILSRLNSTFGSSVQTPRSAEFPTSRPSSRGVMSNPL